MNDYDEDYLQDTVFELDILLLLKNIMTYIKPDFYRLETDAILKEYETHKEKVNKILVMFINKIFENKKKIIRWELKISVENEPNSDAFNYVNNYGNIMAGTQYINDFLFNIIIQNLLNKKINFELYINDVPMPFIQPIDIEEITNFINEMPDDFHFKTLLEKKLKELDIIGFGFGAILPNTAKYPPQQYDNE